MALTDQKEPVMTQPMIVFSPLQAGLPAAGGALEVLVRVQAPDRPADLAATHLPKRLALVVDRSGSMNGQPLQEALRCVKHIASHLTPQDALALVVYDDKVDTLLPLQPMRSADAVAKAVAAGIRQAVSDPKLWSSALDAMQTHAQQQAGGWLFSWLKSIASKFFLVLLLVLAVYSLGGWTALVAVFKGGATHP
jgi:hypothetical protein